MTHHDIIRATEALHRAVDAAKAAGLPTPVKTCEACGNTVWREGAFFRCAECGALSTEWGGCFTHVGRCEAWSQECKRAQAFMREFEQAEHHKNGQK